MKRPPSQYDEILLSKTIKPKEKIELLANLFLTERKLSRELIDLMAVAGDSERGNCMSALTLISKTEPKFFTGSIDFIQQQLSAKAPRVCWEAAETIGNLAPHFPSDCAQAIPALQKMLQGEGTVLRWSAAYALTELAKANATARVELLPFFEQALLSEENNAIKKMFQKALKSAAIR